MKSAISSLFMVYPGMYFEAFVHQPIFPYITFPLFIIGCFKIFKNSKSLHFYPLIIIIFGTLQTIVYTIMVADPGFFWYFATANFGVNFAVVISMYWIFEYSYYFLVKRSYTFQKVIQKIKSNSIIPKLIKSVFAALIIITMLKVGISPVQKIKAYRNAEDYIKISKWILKNTKVADRVSCGEIGYIGFYTNRKMRDPFCLIHSRFGKEYLLSRKDYLWWFRKDPPEVIIAKYNIFTEKAYPFGIYNKSQELLNYFLKTYKTVYVSGKFHVWQGTG
jgi:hypothetical protein